MALRTVLIVISLCGLWNWASCRADAPWATLTKLGCVVQARAYVVPHQWDSSRYDVLLPQAAAGFLRWDFTLNRAGEVTPSHYVNLTNAQARLPYGAAKQTVVPITLRQYDTLEERVTFRDLDLQPVGQGWMTGFASRLLDLKTALTQTTPSGIRIILPAQEDTFERMLPYNGLGNHLFIRIQTTPSQPRLALSQSPLWRKYHKPIQIQLDCDEPNRLGSYQADNTFKVIAVDLPNLQTATHLDMLTLIVRQRADLQIVPMDVKMPVSRGG